MNSSRGVIFAGSHRSSSTHRPLIYAWTAARNSTASQKPKGYAKALQEWCTGSGCNTAYIPPDSPWENPFVESFNSRLRDEFLNFELFTSVQEAKLLAEQYRIKYNTYRPHSAFQGRTPLEVIQQWKAA